MSSTTSTQEKSRTKPSLFSRFPKWVRWVSLIVVVALLGGGAYIVVKARQATAAASTASTLQTATARTGNLVLEASGSGYLVASTETDVAFEIDGKVAEVDVKLGDKVTKGQLLAKLDDSNLQDKLDTATLALKELTSPEAIANAELAITTAEANVITAQTAVNNEQYWQNTALTQNYYASYVIAKDNLDKAQKAYDNAHVGEYINNANEANAYQTLYAAQQAYNTAEYYYSLYSQSPTQRQIDAANGNSGSGQCPGDERQELLCGTDGRDGTHGCNRCEPEGFTTGPARCKNRPDKPGLCNAVCAHGRYCDDSQRHGR